MNSSCGRPRSHPDGLPHLALRPDLRRPGYRAAVPNLPPSSSPATTRGRNPAVSTVSTVLSAKRTPSSIRTLGSITSANRPLPRWKDFTGRMAMMGTPRSVDRNRATYRAVVRFVQRDDQEIRCPRRSGMAWYSPRVMTR